MDDKPHSEPGAKHPHIKRHPEFFFENALIAIQIEDTLFNVHKYQLIKSEVFSDMFKLPKGEGEPGEGVSPEHPIVMEGVTASDFEALLKVLYASPYSCNQQFLEPLVVPAFRLANMWNFAELRAYLLPFAEGCLSDADKIVFARQFNIEEWLAPAHIRLCQRDEHLTTEEARKLGVDSVLLISRMRERYRKPPPDWPFSAEQYYCESCTGFKYVQKGYNFVCIGCGDFGNGYLRCSGPGALVSHCKKNNHSKLEAEMAQRTATITNGAGPWVFTDKRRNPKSDSELSNINPQEEIVRHPEFFFDNTLVAIQVENTLFNVHKYQLMKSEVFSDMFKMPRAEDDGPEEGSSPEYPIVMKGIAASDFAGLLKVLYASLFSSNQPVPDATLVIPAFRLANMLNFSELRAYLLPLAEKNLNDVDKIEFAGEFDLKEWLAPAYTRLCQREEPLGTEEARKLGIDGTLFVMLMREQYRTSGLKLDSSGYYCNTCTGLSGPYNLTCKGCGNNGPNRYHCSGTGTMAQQGINLADAASIESKVKEWIENSSY